MKTIMLIFFVLIAFSIIGSCIDAGISSQTPKQYSASHNSSQIASYIKGEIY